MMLPGNAGDTVWTKSNTEKVEPATPIQSLLLKLGEWLKVQPEYPLLFLADRRTRRTASQLLAQHIFTIPTAQPQGFNRPTVRKLVKSTRRAVGKQRSKMRAQAERDRDRALKRLAFIETDETTTEEPRLD